MCVCVHGEKTGKKSYDMWRDTLISYGRIFWLAASIYTCIEHHVKFVSKIQANIKLKILVCLQSSEAVKESALPTELVRIYQVNSENIIRHQTKGIHHQQNKHEAYRGCVALSKLGCTQHWSHCIPPPIYPTYIQSETPVVLLLSQTTNYQ